MHALLSPGYIYIWVCLPLLDEYRFGVSLAIHLPDFRKDGRSGRYLILWYDRVIFVIHLVCCVLHHGSEKFFLIRFPHGFMELNDFRIGCCLIHLQPILFLDVILWGQWSESK